MYCQSKLRIADIKNSLLEVTPLSECIVNIISKDVCDAELWMHEEMNELYEAVDTILLNVSFSGCPKKERQYHYEIKIVHLDLYEEYLKVPGLFTQLYKYEEYYLRSTYIRMYIRRLNSNDKTGRLFEDLKEELDIMNNAFPPY